MKIPPLSKLTYISFFRNVDSLVFPAISICNLNDMKLSVMNGTQVDKAILAMDVRLLQNVTNEEYDHLINTAKHTLPDMLVECIFDGEECSHKNFTTFVRSQGDLCWTFNSGRGVQAIFDLFCDVFYDKS